jgi:DME family drug/metabolite transporter
VARVNKGYAWILLAGTAWGSIGVLARWLMDLGLDPLEVAWLRSALPLLGLIPILLKAEKGWPQLEPRDIRFFAFFGLVSGACYNFCYFTAVELVGVTTSVILLYTAPAFAVLFARVVFGEDINLKKAIAVVLSLLGCFLVVKGYDLAALRLNFWGILAGLGSGVTYGLYGVFSKKARQRHSAWVSVFYCNLFGFLFLTFIKPPVGLVPFLGSVPFWRNALILALWGSLVPWVSYNTGVALVEAGRAAVVASVEPVVSAVLAACFLGEVLDLLQGLGMVMVLSAVFFAQGEGSWRRSAAQSRAGENGKTKEA